MSTSYILKSVSTGDTVCVLLVSDRDFIFNDIQDFQAVEYILKDFAKVLELDIKLTSNTTEIVFHNIDTSMLPRLSRYMLLTHKLILQKTR